MSERKVVVVERADRLSQDDQEKIAAFLKSRPEIAAMGTNDSGAWAIYPDGVPLMVLDNRELEALPASLRAAPAVRRGVEVPKPMRARLWEAQPRLPHRAYAEQL